MRAFGSSVTVALGGVLLVATPAAGQQYVTCESNNHREQYCRADTHNGVTLVSQLSQAPCREGHTWGFDDRGIWVNGGCRAEFATGNQPTKASGADAAAVAGAVAAIIGTALIAGDAQKHQEQKQSERYNRGYNDALAGRHELNQPADYNVGWEAGSNARYGGGYHDRGYVNTSAPRAATSACIRYVEAPGFPATLVSATPARTNFWDVIVSTPKGRVSCTVDNSGNVADTRDVR